MEERLKDKAHKLSNDLRALINEIVQQGYNNEQWALNFADEINQLSTMY